MVQNPPPYAADYTTPTSHNSPISSPHAPASATLPSSPPVAVPEQEDSRSQKYATMISEAVRGVFLCRRRKPRAGDPEMWGRALRAGFEGRRNGMRGGEICGAGIDAR